MGCSASAPKKAWSRTGKGPRDYKVNVCICCWRTQPLIFCMGATISSSQCTACTEGQGSFGGNAQLECSLCKLLRDFRGPGWRYFVLPFRRHAPKHHTILLHRGEHIRECSSPSQSYHLFKPHISKSGFMFPAACPHSLAMLPQPHISCFWLWLWEGMVSLLLPTIWLSPRREQVISCNENIMAVYFSKKNPKQTNTILNTQSILPLHGLIQ